jgi:2-dehydro-3-deoxygluconokinase
VTTGTGGAVPGGLDVLCVGETMAMVTPDPGGRLDAASTLRLRAGGAESNVARWLAALGHRAAWAGQVGDDALGVLVTSEVAAAGVDVSLVRVDPHRPTGVYFKDTSPTGTVPLYYRRGSAGSALDTGLVEALAEAQPRVLHLSGVTPALSDGCRRLVEHLVSDRPLGPATTVSFDVNYRPALWQEPAAPRLLAVAQACDVVFVGRDEAETLWGTATAERVRALIDRPGVLVVKDGPYDAVAFSGGTVTREAPAPVEVVEPVGAGDAFAAGWLSGLLRGADQSACLRLGHRLAAAALGSTSDHAPLPDAATLEESPR